MPDEEAFSLLVRLMYVYDLRGHFLPEMPKLQLRLVGSACFIMTVSTHSALSLSVSGLFGFFQYSVQQDERLPSLSLTA